MDITAQTKLGPTPGVCTCGHEHEAAIPVLDARAIPHAIRHGAILGALDGLQAGQALTLVAPHDPIPLLAQISDRFGDRLTMRYDERGPDAWRLTFTNPAL